MREPMQLNRGLLFWGLALITAGVVALAASQRWITRETLVEAWRLWPVVLIAIGLSIVLSRTPFALVGTLVAALVVGAAAGAAFAVGPGAFSCGDAPTTTDTQEGELLTPASVRLELNCGDLRVGLADGTAWQAVLGVTDDPPELSAAENSLNLRSQGASFPFNADRQDWALTLGRDVTYEISGSLNASDARLDLSDGTFSRIELDPNAGALHVDLSGAQVDDFSVAVNAGNLTLIADGETNLSGGLHVNAGAIDVCVPAGTALRFTVDANVTFAHDLDESGLNQSGDTFTSEGFATAAHKIDLRLEGNAASFELNPEDGCE